jgi:hypothetical protein
MILIPIARRQPYRRAHRAVPSIPHPSYICRASLSASSVSIRKRGNCARISIHQLFILLISMKLSIPCVLALLAIGIVACGDSTTTEPTPNNNDTTHTTLTHEPRAYTKNYNTSKGGVQITRIYYDQNMNRDSALLGLTVPDECVLLETNTPTSLNGWVLDASDNQLFRFDTSVRINDKLYIFTEDGPTTSSTTAHWITLGRGSFVWNNAEPDTAKLFNESGVLVDMATYVGK